LAATKDDLQATVEQLESSNEEFKVSNEEVMSINEELQSTNEELETSKEELQSLNEELSTVNNQLAGKVDELETKTSDLQNLLTATDVATICLDTDLAIRWFTPAAQEVIRLREADKGRPLADFADDFNDGELVKVARRVLDKLEPVEDEACCDDGRTFLRRVTPYRTDDHRIGGVVITFFDLTERKKAEDTLVMAKEMAEKIVDTVRESMLVLDMNLRVVSANESFYDTFQVSPAETEGRLVYELGNDQWDIPELRNLLENVLPENNVFNEFEVTHEFQTIGRKVMVLNGRKIDHIERILLAIEDVTQRRESERVIRESEERMRRVLNIEGVGVLTFDSDGTLVDANDAFLEMTGYSRDQVESGQLTWRDMTPDEFVDESERQLQNLSETGRIGPYEKEYLLQDGSRSWMLFAGADLGDGTIIEYCIDVQDRKQAEQALHISEERLRLATEMTGIGTWEWFPETDNLQWSEVACRLVGCEPVATQTESQTFFDRVHPDDLAELRRAVDAAIEQEVPYDQEVRVVRADGEVRWLACKGEVLRDNAGKAVRMMGVNYDITQRKHLEQELNSLNESLEQQVSQRTALLRLLQDITRVANEARTVDEAMLAAMKRISQFNGWQVGHAWRLADEGSGQMVSSGIWFTSDEAHNAIGKLEEFQETCATHRFAPGEGMVGAVMQSRGPQWVDDIKRYEDWRRGSAEEFGLHAAIAFPVTVNNGEVVAVLELFSDHTVKRDKRFMEIMPDVGMQLGHVIERKRLERVAADMTEAEQRRIGSDIHDGVGQELTGLRYMAQTHAEKLDELSSPEVKTAQRISEWLEKMQQQLRLVIRRLVPVEIDEHGLVDALRGLAERTTETHDVVCRLECAQSIRVADATLATHMYRIAQEAVRNAVRHAGAGEIWITLNEDAGLLKLAVEDDGIGIPKTTNQETGFGLRSMAYRAGLIGGQFDCQPREEGGTRVTCTVFRTGG
jgi:PAS domain S-box-containing protein